MRPAWSLLVLSALSGFLALVQEVLWFRLGGLGFRDQPTVFAYVLGWLLVGLAFGAWVGPRLLKWATPLRLVAGSFAASAVLALVAPTLVGRLFQESLEAGQTAIHALVAVVALINGLAFPVLCHVASRDGAAAGQSVGWMYFANVVGSTLGPLVMGFWLLDVLGTNQAILALSLGFLAAALLVLAVEPQRWWGALVGTAAVGGVLVLAYPVILDRLLERVVLGPEFDPRSSRFRILEETHSGVISVIASPRADIIYGDGVYDGRFNTGLEPDYNGIFRAYASLALHPRPERVLVVGLASGSWAHVIAAHRAVKEMIIVEINEGYIDVIRHYPEPAALLTDPRVSIVVDDGRRWMARHPEEQFDLIVVNTTFHWRAHSTHLLSREFFELARTRLRAGGVFFFNATGSDDARATAIPVFRHGLRVFNSLALSDAPLEATPEERRARLLQIEENGRPWFEGREHLLESIIGRIEPLPIFVGQPVTDDNMRVEFGKRQEAATWFRLGKDLLDYLQW